jgi:uncharacterized protein YdaU (DUF1376 family)
MDWVQVSGLLVIVCGGVAAFFILDLKPWPNKRCKTKSPSGDEQNSIDQSASKSQLKEVQSWHEGVPQKQFVIEFEGDDARLFIAPS